MDEQRTEPFSGFTLLMARLWKARWVIVGTAAVFAIVTYLNLKFLTPETFRSETVIYLAEDTEPPTIEALAMSLDTLDAVRERFLDQYPNTKDIDDMKKWKRRFHMDQVIVEDNSLRKEYSPAVTLAADAHSQERAQTLATLWLDEIIQRFGGVSGLEARFRSQHARDLLDDLKSREQRAVEQQTARRFRSAELEKRLYQQYNFLAPVNIPESRSERQFRPFIEGFVVENPQFSVDVPPVAESREPGLIERKMRLQADLAKTQARLESYEEALKMGPTDDVRASLEQNRFDLRADVAGMKSEAASLNRLIAEAEDEISSLTAALQTVKSDLAAASAEVAALRFQQEVVGSMVAEYISNGYLSEQAGLPDRELSARLDFSVVAEPSMPDKKIAPQRVVNGILAGIIGGFLACLVMGLAHFVEQLPELSRRGKK